MTEKGRSTALEPEIRQLVASITGQEPHLDDNLFETGLLDSLMAVNLILELEGTFKLPLTERELNFDNLQSVRRIARWIYEVQSCSEA